MEYEILYRLNLRKKYDETQIAFPRLDFLNPLHVGDGISIGDIFLGEVVRISHHLEKDGTYKFAQVEVVSSRDMIPKDYLDLVSKIQELAESFRA